MSGYDLRYKLISKHCIIDRLVAETFLIGLANRLAPISEFKFGSDGFSGVRNRLVRRAWLVLKYSQLFHYIPFNSCRADINPTYTERHIYGGFQRFNIDIPN
ncbi:hypothetical protein C8J57DRAFT_1230743 [Mycena rebaudengoi]|nr:hypothetical protein C8J57DRAFT_1230743 [Mycena rebaudengoi]